MRAGWIYKNTETGVRVTITKVHNGTFGKRLHFVDRRGKEDFSYEKPFLEDYELHDNSISNQ